MYTNHQIKNLFGNKTLEYIKNKNTRGVSNTKGNTAVFNYSRFRSYEVQIIIIKLLSVGYLPRQHCISPHRKVL
ncbi:MAG: hypothetical protein GC195_08040 [Nostoc sp. RI_552]|nr:hypothetical protein [Nostoc sp. RI_552]